MKPIATIIAEVCAKHGLHPDWLFTREERVTVYGTLPLARGRYTTIKSVPFGPIRGEIVHRLRAERNMSYPECAAALGMAGHSSASSAHRAYLKTIKQETLQ